MSEQAANSLKEIGLKVTPQRQAVLRFIEGTQDHPSAQAIHREMVKIHPNMSFATVYNTLARLAAAGKIQELDIDPKKKRFDPCVLPHHHFYCTVCGEVFDVARDISAGLGLPATREMDGHRVNAIQVNLKGVCKDCSKKR